MQKQNKEKSILANYESASPKDKRALIACAIVIGLFFTFPLLHFNEGVRNLFLDWTPVAIEVGLLILVIITLGLSSLGEERRTDTNENFIP